MTFARTLVVALAIAAGAHAQQPDLPPPAEAPAKAAPRRVQPAPIIRSTPQAQGDTDTAPQPIHLPSATTSATKSSTTSATRPSSANPQSAAPRPAEPKPIASKLAPAAATKSANTVGPAAPLPVALNRTTIIVDPAHGGSDTGSHINDSLSEKDVTLALAFKLRSLLAARGFNVLLTRDSDTATSATGQPLQLDERAGIANHARPAACLLIHATDAGRGVHLYTSELAPVPAEPSTVPWLTAQAAYVPQSQRLAAQLSAALTRAKIPTVVSAASVRPVDSLQCPALVIELAPNDGKEDTLSDGAYQQRVAEALSSALTFWQNQVQPILRVAPPPPPPPPPAVAAPVTHPAEPQP